MISFFNTMTKWLQNKLKIILMSFCRQSTYPLTRQLAVLQRTKQISIYHMLKEQRTVCIHQMINFRYRHLLHLNNSQQAKPYKLQFCIRIGKIRQSQHKDLTLQRKRKNIKDLTQLEKRIQRFRHKDGTQFQKSLTSLIIKLIQ